MAHLVNQSGNIDDIRNTLRLMPIAGTKKELFAKMVEMQHCITNERENYNRKTVITLIESYIRKLKKVYRSIEN
jgi:hypothetical protein